MVLRWAFGSHECLRLLTGEPAFPPIWDALPAPPPVCSQPSRLLCEPAKGSVLPWNNQGPPVRARGPGPCHSTHARPSYVAHFSLGVCRFPEAGTGLCDSSPPPTLKGQGRPLSFLRHFVPKLKSPLHMPLACTQPAIPAWPGVCGEGEHRRASPAWAKGQGPPGNQATRVGRAPPPSALICIPCEPPLGNASKGALGLLPFSSLDHNKPPCPSESTLCLPRASPMTATRAFSLCVMRTLPEGRRCGEEGRLSPSLHTHHRARPGTQDVTSPLLNHEAGALITPISRWKG